MVSWRGGPCEAPVASRAASRRSFERFSGPRPPVGSGRRSAAALAVRCARTVGSADRSGGSPGPDGRAKGDLRVAASHGAASRAGTSAWALPRGRPGRAQAAPAACESRRRSLGLSGPRDGGGSRPPAPEAAASAEAWPPRARGLGPAQPGGSGFPAFGRRALAPRPPRSPLALSRRARGGAGGPQRGACAGPPAWSWRSQLLDVSVSGRWASRRPRRGGQAGPGARLGHQGAIALSGRPRASSGPSRLPGEGQGRWPLGGADWWCASCCFAQRCRQASPRSLY